MRIVLDTNVALSGLLWRGTPWRLIGAIRHQSGHRLFSSAALRAELADVLVRPFASRRLAMIGRSTEAVLADYGGFVEMVAPVAVPAVVAADPDDDHVIAAAVAAEADLIVSGDSHLLGLGHHGGMRIVTPAEALAMMDGVSRSDA